MQIGNYKLTHRLGAGGMGTVFRAVDSLSWPVALKFIGSQEQIDATIFGNPSSGNSPALDLRYRMMLIREARLAMGLNHPNILQVFDYNQYRGLLYIVMELLEGRSLDKVIPLYSAIRATDKIELVRQLCAALDYAHSQNVIHRDIKPGNCRVLPDGTLKVMDFGLAARPNKGAGDLQLVGTFPYMAPELFHPRPQYSEKSDTWAAGVTLYQLLTGSLPFTGSSFIELKSNIIQQAIPPLSDKVPNKETFTRILTRALAKDPTERYASAAELGYQLSLVGKEGSIAIAAPGRAARPNEGHWWATNVAQETAITGTLPTSTEANISPVSGEVKARRRGYSVRFADYNHGLQNFLPVGILCSVGYIFLEVTGWKVDEFNWIWVVPAYLAGLLIPLAVAGSIALGALAFWEELSGTPRCGRCREIVQPRCRTTAFVYTEISWKHALSDCLAALREDLWSDASRLLSIHGALAAPPEGESTDYSQLRLRAYPQLRLHLDMYSCAVCGDELAILTTDDRLERAWGTRAEYEGMSRSYDTLTIKRGLSKRIAGILQALSRAAHAWANSISPAPMAITLVSTLLIAIYYYPQFPVIVGIPGYQSVVTVQTDPPGVEISVDHFRVVTPHTFSWLLGSGHDIDFELRIRKKGQLYTFDRLVPADATVTIYDWTPYIGGRPTDQHGSIMIRSQASFDRRGRLTRPLKCPTYTIIYFAVPENGKAEQGIFSGNTEVQSRSTTSEQCTH